MPIMTADLYKQANLFYLPGAHKQVEQPAMRNYLGQTLISMRDNVAYEAALGDHGRSGEQFDIWQAVYSPVGRTVTRHKSSTKKPAPSITRLPHIGRITMTWMPFSRRTGTSWVRCCRVSCTSMSGRPTLTF